MKNRKIRLLLGALASFALLLTISCLCSAEELPGADCFSPGFHRMGAYQTSSAPTETELTLNIQNALFIPDVKALSAVFSGLTLRAETEESGGAVQTGLSVLCGADEIASAWLRSEQGKTLLYLGSRWLTLPESADAPEIPDSFLPVLKAFSEDRFLRMPAESLKTAFDGWNPGESFLGFSPAEKMETVSGGTDNGGSRLTVSGNLIRENERWSFSASFQKGAGENPKDEAELLVALDEDNRYALTVSSQRKKTGKGETGGSQSVTIRAALEGKRDGYPVDGSASVTRKNAWSKKDGVLDERISSTSKITFRDKTPGQSYLNLGRDTVSLKETIHCRSTDGKAPDGWTDDIKLSVETDGGVLFSGGASLSVKPAGGHLQPPEGAENADGVTAEELAAAIRAEAQQMAARIYRHMNEAAKKQVKKGL